MAKLPRSFLRMRISTKQRTLPLPVLSLTSVGTNSFTAPATHLPLLKLIQHGQICMSTERIFVDESVLDQFAAKLTDAASNFEVHPGATRENASRVSRLVSDAIGKGAKFLYGETLLQEGSHLTPRILANVTRDMDIWHEETFGPIALLVSFRTPDEAVNMANDCAYGLSASIFTANIPQAISLAQRIDSGAVHINSMTIHDEAHMPHGGTKNSGWGRFGVPWGIIPHFLYMMFAANHLRLCGVYPVEDDHDHGRPPRECIDRVVR